MRPSTLLQRVRLQLFLQTLRRTQYMAPGELHAYQMRLLGGVLRHAAENVPFYKGRVEAALRPDGTADMERFREIPILTRDQAQADPEALTAREMTELAGQADYDATSGSTGQSFRHKRNTLADVASRCLLERSYEWAGIEPGAVMADIRVDRAGTALPPKGRRGAGWSLSGKDGPVHSLTIDADVAQQVDWLAELRPDYLLTYPSNARAVAEAMQDRGLALDLKGIMTGSETVGPEMRALFREVFGCPLSDHYGCQEIGYLAGECPEAGQYLVAAESILLELLDEDGVEVGPGEIGRVVLTSFYNYAMPFIRYEIGDYARRGSEESVCGRTLPRLAEIMGRTRNMFTFPGGRTIWPNTLQSEMKKYLPIRRMQVIQKAPLEIVVRYTRAADGAPEDYDGLVAYMRGKLDPRIAVELDEIGAFAPRPGRKFEDYLSLVSGR